MKTRVGLTCLGYLPLTVEVSKG